MDEPPVDAAALDALEDDLGGADAMREVLAAFLEEVPGLLAGVRAALDAGDAATARRLAHSLKSTSASFGARRLSLLSAELERAAASDFPAAALLATRLGAEWARARPPLAARLDALR